MLKGIKNVKIDTVKNAVPAFLTIAMMPLAYSITDGIGFGILSYVIIDLIIYIVDAIKYAVNKSPFGICTSLPLSWQCSSLFTSSCPPRFNFA